MNETSFPLDPYRIVLVEAMYPGNVGAVARLATNYGIRDVSICQPRCAWNEGEALLYARSHSKHHFETFAETNDLPSSLTGLTYSVGFSRRRGDLRNPNVELWEISKLSARGRVGLVFGCEESGLSTEQLLQCTHICSLPTAPEMPSLNLSHAIAVVVSRIFEAHLTEAANPNENKPAHGAAQVFNDSTLPREKDLKMSEEMKHLLSPVLLENFEKLIQHFRTVMTLSGLTLQGNPDRMLQDIRRIFQRSHLNNRETNILHGVLSAFERTLRNSQLNK